MKRRHWIALVAVLAAAIGCTHISEDEALEMTKQLVQAQVSSHMQEEHWVWETDWTASLEVPVTEANDRIPEWAASKYTRCVTWDAPFIYREWNHARQRGEPEHYDHEERVQAWVMYDRRFRVHILEITYTYEDRTHTAVDGWDPPDDDS